MRLAHERARERAPVCWVWLRTSELELPRQQRFRAKTLRIELLGPEEEIPKPVREAEALLPTELVGGRLGVTLQPHPQDPASFATKRRAP